MVGEFGLVWFRFAQWPGKVRSPRVASRSPEDPAVDRLVGTSVYTIPIELEEGIDHDAIRRNTAQYDAVRLRAAQYDSTTQSDKNRE